MTVYMSRALRKAAQSQSGPSAAWRGGQVRLPAVHVAPYLPAPSMALGAGFAKPRGSLSAAEAADLIEAIAAEGDKAAFTALYCYYVPRIRAFIARGGADDDVAQEVAQETLIAVWRKAASFDRHRASPITWLFIIARSKRIDLLRRNSSPHIATEDWLAAFSTDQVDADLTIDARQMHSRVGNLLGRLPKDQVVVIEKAFFQHKTHTEIAEELAVPLGTIKSRIRLALHHLRDAAKKDGFDLDWTGR